jgi:hypothetical protein
VDTDTQETAIARGGQAGGLHGMVELIDSDRHLLDKAAACLGQPDASRMTLEQKDA